MYPGVFVGIKKQSRRCAVREETPRRDIHTELVACGKEHIVRARFAVVCSL